MTYLQMIKVASSALACTVLVACTSSSGDASASLPDTSLASPPSGSAAVDGSSSPAQARQDPDVFSLEPAAESREGEPVRLVSVELTQEPDLDRVVITTTGSEAPGWAAQYVEVVRVDGEPVLLDGAAFLELALSPADPNGDQGLVPEVTRELTGDGAVQQVAFARYVDGTVTFAIGLDEQRPFRLVADDDSVTLEVER